MVMNYALLHCKLIVKHPKEDVKTYSMEDHNFFFSVSSEADTNYVRKKI